jgi:hypothetical protein
MRLLPPGQIPDFKTAAPADESDLALQADAFAKIFRKEKAPLAVGRAMLGAGVQLPKKNATVARRHLGIGLDRGAHTRKLRRRHDHQKLILRLRKNDEFLGAIAAPAGGNGDAIFFVEGVSELTGVEELGWRRRIHVREENSTILTHFPPLLTTFPAGGQYIIPLFFRPARPSQNLPPPRRAPTLGVEPSRLSVLILLTP